MQSSKRLFIVLGGGREIGANAQGLLFRKGLKQTLIVPDFGKHPQHEFVPRHFTWDPAIKTPLLPDFEIVHKLVKNSTRVIFCPSHLHEDHLGGSVCFWMFMKEFFPKMIEDKRFVIMMTRETEALARLVLGESVRQMQTSFSWRDAVPRYTMRDIDEMLAHVIPYARYEDPDIPELSFSPGSAGHILGAASLYFSAWGDLGYVSGDVAEHNELALPACPPPEGKYAFACSELTYAKVRHRDREETKRAFVGACRQTIENDGIMLNPALQIHAAVRNRQILIDGGIPPHYIWMDGGAGRFAKEFFKLIPERITPGIQCVEDWDHREWIALNRVPGIIIASSGMLHERSIAHWWAEQVIEDEHNAISETNYHDPCTPMEALFNPINIGGDEWVTLKKRHYRRDARIVSARIPSHDDERRILERLQEMRPAAVAFVHTEKKKVLPRLGRLRRKLGTRVEFPKTGDEIEF